MGAEEDRHPGRFRALSVLCASQLLGMAPWFVGNAVAPQLAARWGLGAAEVGWLTSAVQLGFVAGTALSAVLNLADLVSGRVLVAVSALGAAASNAVLVAVPGYPAALAARFLTGLFLAGVYPPAMKMAATWFRSSRGLAIGALIGALTMGKALPYPLRAGDAVAWESVVLAVSAGAAGGALLVGVAYHDGPFAFPRRSFSWALAGTVAAHRETRLAVLGYLGHMWELYAMWTWLPAFLAASAIARGAAAEHASAVASVHAFATIAIGAAGCLWGGWMADRIGRERLVSLAMAASGGCALVIGLFFGAHPLLWPFNFIFQIIEFIASATVIPQGFTHAANATDYVLGTIRRLSGRIQRIYFYNWVANPPPFSWDSAFVNHAIGHDLASRPACTAESGCARCAGSSPYGIDETRCGCAPGWPRLS